MTNGGFPMSTVRLSRVQEKGQVTIPTKIRKKLKLKKGDLVSFVETERGVVIKPAEVIVTEALEEIGRALKRGKIRKGKNKIRIERLTLEQLIERGREIRGKLIEEEYGLSEPQPK